jgi:hypothetical protein
VLRLLAQLVAGLIVGFRQIEADLENIAQADRSEYLDIGWSFFVIGFKKSFARRYRNPIKTETVSVRPLF